MSDKIKKIVTIAAVCLAVMFIVGQIDDLKKFILKLV